MDMKKSLFLAIVLHLILILPSCSVQKEVEFSILENTNTSIILEGSYKGQKVIIQHPYIGDGWCATEVHVNGTTILTESELKMDTFVIDLKKLQFEPGDKVIIKIYHKVDCRPKVMNQAPH